MNVADVISRHAQERPDAPAVIESGRTWSYRGFDAAIRRAAAALHAAGLGPGDIACVSLPSNALHLATSHALARLGVVQLAFTERDSMTRREQLAARFAARAIVGADATNQPAGVPVIHADPAWLEDAPAPAAPVPQSDGGGAGWKIALTSGSTGVPKAVLLTHAMQLAWCRSNQGAVPALPSDRYLATLPLDFDAGLRHCLFVHWAGGAVMFAEAMDMAEAYFATAERLGATYLSLTPAHLHQLLAVCTEDRPRLPRVRILRSGGMVHTEALRRAVRSRITPNLYVMYGTNDGGSPLTCASGDTLDRHPESVGFPCPGVEIGIADEAGIALPAGSTGLVRIRAEGVPAGYMDDAEATARSFRDGWYYTGDMGRLSPEGALYFKGRADDMMNYDGIKIYPSEIEQALLAHPAVAEAAAFPLPSAQHQGVPSAAVVLGGAATAADLRRHCEVLLGARAPKSIAVLRALPRNPAGKVDKRRLAGLIQEKMARGRQT